MNEWAVQSNERMQIDRRAKWMNVTMDLHTALLHIKNAHSQTKPPQHRTQEIQQTLCNFPSSLISKDKRYDTIFPAICLTGLLRSILSRVSTAGQFYHG
jgi:hypothetical protein